MHDRLSHRICSCSKSIDPKLISAASKRLINGCVAPSDELPLLSVRTGSRCQACARSGKSSVFCDSGDRLLSAGMANQYRADDFDRSGIPARVNMFADRSNVNSRRFQENVRSKVGLLIRTVAPCTIEITKLFYVLWNASVEGGLVSGGTAGFLKALARLRQAAEAWEGDWICKCITGMTGPGIKISIRIIIDDQIRYGTPSTNSKFKSVKDRHGNEMQPVVLYEGSKGLKSMRSGFSIGVIDVQPLVPPNAWASEGGADDLMVVPIDDFDTGEVNSDGGYVSDPDWQPSATDRGTTVWAGALDFIAHEIGHALGAGLHSQPFGKSPGLMGGTVGAWRHGPTASEICQIAVAAIGGLKSLHESGCCAINLNRHSSDIDAMAEKFLQRGSTPSPRGEATPAVTTTEPVRMHRESGNESETQPVRMADDR